MSWPFLVDCLFIRDALVVWLAISWRRPDRRPGRDPDDWQRLGVGGTDIP